jgi:hypothetical protein
MKTQHTPGPWTPHKDASPRIHWVEADNRHQFTIIRHLGDAGEAAANAQLIAAAPDMLAALQSALDSLHEGATKTGPEHAVFRRRCEIDAAQVQAAIFKATQ